MNLFRQETLTEHAVNTYSVSFHPNGKLIAHVGTPPGVFIYDVVEKKFVKALLGIPHPMYSVLFSEEHLLVTGEEGKVIVFDKTLNRQYEFLTNEEQKQIPNFSLVLSPNKKTLAVGSMDGMIYFYETNTWQLVNKVSLHTSRVRAMAYSIEGGILATGGSDKKVVLYDVEQDKKILDIEGHGGSVFSLAFSKDGKRFATGGHDARLRIWDVEGKHFKPKIKMLAHQYAIKSIGFVNEGNFLVSTSQDKTIKIWDVESANMVASVPQSSADAHLHSVNTLALSPDETMLVTGSDDKTIKLWKIN